MNTRRPIQDLSGATLAERYFLERRIGCGGFAAVYRAVDRRLGSIVAVKVLHPENTRNVKDVDRFFNEARIAAKISDDRLVKVFDFFQDGDRFGFVMEHLDGRTLRDVLVEQEGVMVWWPRAFKIALEVCQGLDVAHAYDIVHRDIKPENIFLTRARDGVERVKLLDLGIAKVLQSWSGVRQGLSNARDQIGSPFYMAPEQVEGTTGCNARADIYSLGVVLYEMVTGDVPFRGSNDFETMYHHVKSAPTPPLTLRPTLKMPRALEGIIMTALSKRPDDRFRDVQEMAKAITFELDRNSSKQRVWHAAQMLPAVTDAALPVAVTTRIDEGSPPNPATERSASSESWKSPPETMTRRPLAGRVVEDMTTQKRSAEALPASGIVRTQPRPDPVEARTRSVENDLTPAPKIEAPQPSGNTKITSPDVEAATSESRTIPARSAHQLGLHPRSIMMLASMIAASLIATCSVGSVLAMVLDARHDPRAGSAGRGRVEIIAPDEPAEEEPQRPERPPSQETAPQTSAGTHPETESPAVTPEHIPEAPPTNSETTAEKNAVIDVAPSPPAKRPQTTRKTTPPVKTEPSTEDPSVLLPITSTMKSIADRAASAIRKQCKISRFAGQRTHEYKVLFTIRKTGEVVSVADNGEAPIMVKEDCVSTEAKRLVTNFAGAADLRESYDHTFSVVRE